MSVLVLNGGALAVDSQRREPLERLYTSTNQRQLVLNGGAVAVDSQRREPLDIGLKRVGESRSDGISVEAATSTRHYPIAARWTSAQWHTSHSPPFDGTRKPAAHAADRGLSSLSGLRKWLSDLFVHETPANTLHIN